MCFYLLNEKKGHAVSNNFHFYNTFYFLITCALPFPYYFLGEKKHLLDKGILRICKLKEGKKKTYINVLEKYCFKI